MKNLKLVAAMALFFGLSTVSVSAQEKDKKAQKMEQVKIAKEKLALTPDQEAKFMEVNKKYGSRMKAVNQEARKERIKNLKTIKSERDAEMKSILSESQYKSYLELQEQRKAKIKERMKDRRKQ